MIKKIHIDENMCVEFLSNVLGEMTIEKKSHKSNYYDT